MPLHGGGKASTQTRRVGSAQNRAAEFSAQLFEEPP